MAKIPNKGNRSVKTLSNYSNEGHFLEDRLIPGTKCESTKREKGLISHNSNTLDVSKEVYTEPNVAKDTEKEEYLVMIKELRLEIMAKNRDIETLLINEQEFESAMEMLREREKQKNT